MSPQFLWRSRHVFLVACFAAIASDRAWSQEATDSDVLLQRIFSDWAERNRRFDSIVYDFKGQELWAPGSAGRNGPQSEKIGQFQGRMEVDFRRSLARFETYRDFPSGNSLQKNFWAMLYDGKRRTQWKPREKNPWARGAIIVEAHFDIPWRMFFEGAEPVLYAHGLLAEGEDRLSPERMEPSNAKDGFAFSRKERLGERDCAVLRHTNPDTGQFDELWVDVERDSAVLKRGYWVDGRLRETQEIGYVEKDGFWRVNRWVRTLWNNAGVPFRRATCSVVGVEQNPGLPLERFQVEPKPGMVIHFGKDRRSKVYMGKDQEPIDADEYFKRFKPSELPLDRPASET